MDAVESFATQLEALTDPTLRARAIDIRDVGRRVLCHLLGLPVNDFQLSNPAVIIADDLSPSQTASLDKKYVLAFCTAKGGPTSHTAILAKGLGLPAVVGLGQQVLSITPGAIVLVDGTHGHIVVDPDDLTLTTFQKLSDRSNLKQLEDLEVAAHPAVTLDGVRVEVVANIGGLEDVEAALKNGAEGVGLFRTEFLYLGRHQLPTEEEQVQVYRQIFNLMGTLPIVVRTLDIGGDKAVPYIGFQEEANPFLGWRAIRMNEGRPDVFQSQVRALLQAGVESDLRIMIPMVSNIEEIELARNLMAKAATELQNDGLPCAKNVQFGIMVEIPSTALIAERLAPGLDFFSIGTNDLTQYALAVDRTNERVAHLGSPFHPAVLQLIQMTIQAAHKHHKWAGVCGELAGEVIAVPLLLGFGLDEFSVAPALIPSIKRAIRKCVYEDCKIIAERALALSSITAVTDMLNKEAKRLEF
jgi:phosphoenolpyruvate-protein phosphotransferase